MKNIISSNTYQLSALEIAKLISKFKVLNSFNNTP